jgi:hypothetical protein
MECRFDSVQSKKTPCVASGSEGGLELWTNTESGLVRRLFHGKAAELSHEKTVGMSTVANDDGAAALVDLLLNWGQNMTITFFVRTDPKMEDIPDDNPALANRLLFTIGQCWWG